MNILIVDDENDIRDILSDLFERLGDFNVVDTASEGQEAIDKIKKCKYDILLTDINMPNGLGGFDLINNNNLLDNKVENVYVMSGYIDNQVIINEQFSYVKGFLKKPLSDYKYLIKKINNKESL